MGVHVKSTLEVAGLGLRKLFRESLPHDRLPKQTQSSPTLGSHCAESASEVSTSTQNTSKVSETEDPVEVFRRIVENPKVLSPNSPASPIDNYNELFGQLKSKLVAIDFLHIVIDNTPILFEIQRLLLRLSNQMSQTLLLILCWILNPYSSKLYKS